MGLRHQSFDKRLGARLRAARLEHKWTLDKLGKKMGVRHNTVYKTENGLVKITCERLVAAARALGKQAGDLLSGL